MSRKLSKNEIEIWLQENRPEIVLIDWSGSASGLSKFKDTKRDVVFFEAFARVKNRIKNNPNTIFGTSPKEKQKILEQSLKEKYGVKHALQSKQIKEKMKKTHLDRWGTEWPTQRKDVREKIEKSTQASCGYKTILSHPDIIKQNRKPKTEEVLYKIHQTNKARYGSPNPFGSEIIQQKIKKTRIEKGDWMLFDDKTVYEWAKLPQTASHMTIRKAIKSGSHPEETSPYSFFIEEKIKHFLTKNNIRFDHNKKFPCGSKKNWKRPDFLLLDYKLIIEVDGDEIHGNPKFWKPNDWVGHPKSPILAKDKWEIDLKRSEMYKSFGYKLLRFWEDEILNDWNYVKERIIKEISK